VRDKRTRQTGPGLRVARCQRDGFTDIFITVVPLDGEESSAVFRRLDDYLREARGVRILREDMFGLVRPQDHSGLHVEWPVTWVLEEGGRPSPRLRLTSVASAKDVGRGSAPAAGIHVQAVRGVPVRPIRMGGRVVGTVFENGHARYCVLGDIRPENAGLPREKQARRTFEMMEEALALAGMDFSHVVRTWLFIESILAWYGGFNRARTSFFTERGVFDGMVPASTGIGGTNSPGTAIVAGLLAIRPADGRVRIEPLPSPLQCPALEYGSSFSRAVEVTMPDHRRLFVSGTASIDSEGRTAHVGDVNRQVALTMEVVAAILTSRGMDWSDVTRAIAYFKHAADTPVFDRYCAERDIPPLPVVIANNDICRAELLFEIEVDAALPG
jgi:enamine deaminase RidA (YjgF/YER057c/UK114 family)